MTDPYVIRKSPKPNAPDYAGKTYYLWKETHDRAHKWTMDLEEAKVYEGYEYDLRGPAIILSSRNMRYDRVRIKLPTNKREIIE